MILADTHAWLWWLTENSRLSDVAKAAMDSQAVGISSVSMWEVALLAAKGRIEIGDVHEWLQRAVERPGTVVLDFTAAICATGAGFGTRFPKDPSDRLIVATALHHDLALATADQAITSSGLIRTVW